MTTIAERLGPLCPPLRMVTTAACNGTCGFCHREGFQGDPAATMPEEILGSAVMAARDLGFEKVVFSGGEPTLLRNLPELVDCARRSHPTALLGLVTNGFALESVWGRLRDHLDFIDVSIHSLVRSRYSRLTRVCPDTVLRVIQERDSNIIVTVNCVVTGENVDELDTLITMAKTNGLSLSIMSPVPVGDASGTIASGIARIIRIHKLTCIKLRSTPTLEGQLGPNTFLRVKLPYLSQLVRWNRCATCTQRDTCGEYLCAVRVYPDGSVSACRLKSPAGKAVSTLDMRTLISNTLLGMTGVFEHWTDLVPWISGRLHEAHV